MLRIRARPRARDDEWLRTFAAHVVVDTPAYFNDVVLGLLEASDSPVKGKNGYAPAPVDKTQASGWLWSWALAIPATSSQADKAWKFISFATGPQYLKEAGSKVPGGWASIPPGTRKSTYEIPEYKKAAAAFAKPTLDAISSAPIGRMSVYSPSSS